jgi:hypothetical protein
LNKYKDSVFCDFLNQFFLTLLPTPYAQLISPNMGYNTAKRTCTGRLTGVTTIQPTEDRTRAVRKPTGIIKDWQTKYNCPICRLLLPDNPDLNITFDAEDLMKHFAKEHWNLDADLHFCRFGGECDPARP